MRLNWEPEAKLCLSRHGQAIHSGYTHSCVPMGPLEIYFRRVEKQNYLHHRANTSSDGSG